jgi:serine protease Do
VSRRSWGPNGLEWSIPGVVVSDVEQGSPAAVAGIKKGQLIRRIGGNNIKTPRDFATAAAPLEGPVVLDTDLGRVTVN